MGEVTVIIFHPAAAKEDGPLASKPAGSVRPPSVVGPDGSAGPDGSVERDSSAGPLSATLAAARDALAAAHAERFRRAGAAAVRIDRRPVGASFGQRLAEVAAALPPADGLVVLGAGSVPRLRLADARRLVAAAAGPAPQALTNNRYSSDVCAIARAAETLAGLPVLPGDNALPRWLAERAGVEVRELPGRERLAADIDSPLDLALLGLLPRPPAVLRPWTGTLAVPHLAELRAVLADPRAELLVAGRASSRGLAVLERTAACRIRFLSEERGLRASSPLAQADPRSAASPSAARGQATHPARHPRSVLGRLLEARGGPSALAAAVAELADAAIIDSRVLLADRLGADERRWPDPEDRYASDLLRPEAVTDPWLRALTASAASSAVPIVLGGHSLVGPGLALLVGARMA